MLAIRVDAAQHHDLLRVFRLVNSINIIPISTVTHFKKIKLSVEVQY